MILESEPKQILKLDILLISELIVMGGGGGFGIAIRPIKYLV